MCVCYSACAAAHSPAGRSTWPSNMSGDYAFCIFNIDNDNLLTDVPETLLTFTTKKGMKANGMAFLREL